MKIQDFLKEHGLATNPFSQEDAKEDPVFKECMAESRHPCWDKVYGDPRDPASAVVFGDKGSGKTALRLQVREAITVWNARAENRDRRVFLIDYDDFNPFLDRFCSHEGEDLSRWRLWDHMDAILSLGVRQLVRLMLEGHGADDVLGPPLAKDQIKRLNRAQRRDLLLLATMYDQSTEMSRVVRWERLRKRLRHWAWRAAWPHAFGLLGDGLLVAAVVWLTLHFGHGAVLTFLQKHPWAWSGLLLFALTWIPALRRRWDARRCARDVAKSVRVLERRKSEIEAMVLRFLPTELEGQPIRHLEGADARYALLSRLQQILKTLGYPSIVVLVDRVDEPHAVEGIPENMWRLLDPIFELKFLKHPGLGVKLLLPRELYQYLERADEEFLRRARLDKLNLVDSLVWTGQSLYDLANERLRKCATDGTEGAPLRDLLDPTIRDDEIINYFDRMRIPRNLFKFMFRLLNNHCMDHTGDRPVRQIDRDTWVRTRAAFDKDMDRAMIAG
jgi:hypothetical protein